MKRGKIRMRGREKGEALVDFISQGTELSYPASEPLS